MSDPTRLQRLFAELRRRHVFRTAALYVVGAWVFLQVADLAFPGMGLPDEAIRYVWIALIACFPLALLFAWRYQLTSSGIVRTAPRPADGEPTRPLRAADYLVLGALAIVTAGVLVQLGLTLRQTSAVVDVGPDGRAIPRNTIAVLPLANVTGDPEQEYFAAGMHDALITTLAKIGELTVKAASSTNVFKNVVQPARQTGAELGAAHLVEGSVFRTGDRVRINVRLIDAASEENLWSESYERPIEDILTLQNEVARTIAEQIQVRLTPDEITRLASARRVDPAVYETYLRGMYHLNQYTPEGIQRGLEYLHEAVKLGPGDPLAYAGLAQGYTLIGHGAQPPPGAFARARDAAVRALELDPMFPEAHAAMAEIQLYHDWDWDGAERSFRRALQLNPNLEFAHAHYGWYHQLMGDIDSAIEHMERARQIAPVTPIFSAWLGWLNWVDGRLDHAIAGAQSALELQPNFAWGLFVLGGAYASGGMYEEALATHERLLEVRPNVGRWGLGTTYARMGREDEARSILAELAENPGQKDLLYLGYIHARLGDVSEATRWLEEAEEAHVDWFPWFGAPSPPPTLGEAREALLAEPRIRALVEGLELPAGE